MVCPCCNPCACAALCSAPPSNSEDVDHVSCDGTNTGARVRQLIYYPNAFGRVNPFFDVFVNDSYYSEQDCTEPWVYEYRTISHQCWTSTTRPELPPTLKGKTRYRFRAFALRCNGPSGAQLVDVSNAYLTGTLDYDFRPTDNPGAFPTEVFASEFEYPDFYPDPVPNCLP